MSEWRVRKMDDMHVHLRQGDMLAHVLSHTARQCGRALVMPNTIPAVLTARDVVDYRQSIMDALGGEEDFTPLMTFKVTPGMTAEEIRDLKKSGAVAGKLYPEGVTTNSEGGVTDFAALESVYAAMQEEGLVLCIHGEVPGVFSLDRESAFLSTLRALSDDFPRLRIVLEHATTADAVSCVMDLPDTVAATLTVHHLYLTLDDVIGDKLNPHAFCKPVAKRPADRDALVEAALSGSPKFFLGSDSAPHLISAKECACGAAGVYTAPVLLPALCQLFERFDKRERLEPFTSEFGARFYGLPLNEGSVTLVQESWTVPEHYEQVRPFMAGFELRWRVVCDDEPQSEAETALSRQSSS